MTSSSPARPIRIETLTPQIHGFIRAYVWQVYRGADPVIDDDPAQQTALLVARAICRLIGRDREMLRRLTQELGSYMGAMNPRKYERSEAFKKLIAEFGGDQTDELPAIPDTEPAAAPAFEQALAEPAPVQDAPAAPAPVEVPTHVPAPVIEPAAAPAIEAAPAEPVAAPTHDEPAAPPSVVDAEPAAEPVAVAVEPAAEPAVEAAPSAESPTSDGKRRRKGKKSKGDSGEVAVPVEAAAEAAPPEAVSSEAVSSEAGSSEADASTKAGGEQSDETTNS